MSMRTTHTRSGRGWLYSKRVICTAGYGSVTSRTEGFGKSARENAVARSTKQRAISRRMPLAYQWRRICRDKGMSKYRGILLDIDGTLVDSNDAHARSWVEVL